LPGSIRQRAKDDQGFDAIGAVQANGLDVDDSALAKAMAARLIHALRMQAKRGKIAPQGKDREAIIWGAL